MFFVGAFLILGGIAMLPVGMGVLPELFDVVVGKRGMDAFLFCVELQLFEEALVGVDLLPKQRTLFLLLRTMVMTWPRLYLYFLMR